MNLKATSFDGLMTPDQAKTLRVIVNCIIPSDDYPSASEAGIEAYLTEQLQGDLVSFSEAYRVGLDAMNLEAVHSFGTSFFKLSDSDQNSMLSNVEQGFVKTEWTISPTEFFNLVVEHVMEGYYGSGIPLALEMVGFDPRWTVKESAS